METFLISTGWLLSIATATGNGFVVILVAKSRRLHSSANWFVLSLAVADSAVGVILFPSGYLCNKRMACNNSVQMALFWFAIHASVTNLCALTWDRYIAIVYPFKYNACMTKRRPENVILVAWLIPFTISLALFVGMYVTDSKTALKVLRLTGVSAFDIISCVLLLYAVVRMLVVARAQSHQSSAIELRLQFSHSSMAREETLATRRRKKHNTARFIIALVLFFLGCYIMANCLIICITFSCNISNKAGQIVTLLFVLNSAVNPFVYAFLKKDIKREINNLICKEN